MFDITNNQQNFGQVMAFFLTVLLCPHGGGHIVFSADPVSIGVSTCLHSISLLDGQILVKLTQIYHWEGKKC